MSRYLRFLLIAFTLLLPLAAYALPTITPSAVMYSANQYNGQKVKVEGIISQLMAKVAQDGTPYQTFKLCDANACLQVYAMTTAGGKPTAYKEGAEVTLKGHFWMLVQRGYQTFHNELDIDP